MKSKKLFAILTLVAFMMTLVPMAAFAVAGPADRYSSFYMVDKTTATADGEDKVKVTVYVNKDNQPVDDGEVVYIATYRKGADKLYSNSDLSTLLTPLTTDTGVFTKASANGKVEFYVASTVAGTTKIAVGLKNPTGTDTTSIYQYLVGLTNTTKESVEMIGDVTDITFVAGTGKNMAVPIVGSNVSGNTYEAISVGAKTFEIRKAGASTNFAKSNGTDYYEINFKVIAAGGAPVKDAEVSFSVSDPALTLNKTVATTDQAGIVKVRVSSTKPITSFSDGYQVKAKAGDAEAYARVQFEATGAFKLELVSGGNETVAKDKPYELKFKLYDINGNQIKNTDATEYQPITYAGDIMFEATTKPTDAKLPEKISEASASTSYVTVKGNTSGQYILTLKGAALDKEGDYNIKAYLTNGTYVNVPFKVKKQGDIVRMELSYDSTSVAIGGTTSGATIRYYDAENIVEKVTSHSNTIFSTSPAPIGATINQTTGEITVINNKDYKGSFTVLAVNNDKKLSASTTLTLTREVANIKVVDVTEAAPGSAAKITLQLYDIEGVETSFGTATVPSLNQKVVTVKPADSIVTISEAADFAADLQKKGTSTVDVKSTKAGTVIVDLVIQNGTTLYPVQATVNFAEPAPPKEVIGAKNVTMFIGAPGYTQDGVAKVTDVAPFIQDGRTFVAVRPVADAFGAEIGWDEATQTVTLTRSDITVTIVIGSSTITVVKDGVTSTVTADVAAFIKDGRTVLPFRAVGEAFGATVNYDAATQSVTYEQ